jgi:glycosyltransferase involved in cell wall biosynthesis
LNILHVITGLNQGGAEAALYRLVSSSPPIIQHTIISVMNDGFYGSRLQECGAKVHTLDMRNSRISLWGLLRLYQIIRRTKPDVVQTWMYHANLIGGLIARLAGVRAIIFGIHHADTDFSKFKWTSILVVYINKFISYFIPVGIVYVSENNRESHRKFGFCSATDKIIYNGVDLNQFRPSETERVRTRVEWDIKPDEILIGLVARWNVYKDHRNLLEALSLLAAKSIPIRCVLVGTEMDAGNLTLTDLIATYGLEMNMILAGSRPDVPAVMNALDLHVLSSSGEAFGNVTVEAMACGTPCVSTDVGAASMIIGDAGWVVPPRDAVRLSQGIEAGMAALNSCDRNSIRINCRQRVSELFGVEKMVESYLTLWAMAINKTKG